MKITLHGAAGEVTGSAYHVQTNEASVLVDFGIFQGRELAAGANVVPPQLDPGKLTSVVLTHAHLDHTGRLPLLVKAGYRGPIYATPASLELAKLVLEDAGKIQEHDSERINRKRAERDEPAQPPLFTIADVAGVVALFKPLPYVNPTTVAPGVTVRMYEAGHLLGSASIEMEIAEAGKKKTVVFSGDIGPRGAPILRDAACLTRADLVFLESTYGDRDHRSLADTVKEFREIVAKAVKAKGKILVPTFALGRAQQILYHLAEMFDDGVVPRFPVILDSPMAIQATEIYVRHPELYDEDMKRMVKERGLLQRLERMQHSVTGEDSKKLNDLPGPCIILAGAGMANAGRIVHHLRHGLPLAGTDVLIVGYQSPGSLGRHLVDGDKEVSIFGEHVPVRAAVHTLGGFSAHAGQTDLMEWFSCPAHQRPRVVLTHGEEKGRKPLAQLIQQRYGIQAVLPMLGDVIEL
jgi:metallo-beta-lactamase family protein